jgi:cyclopropane-fatty-acyl-phospholipid synthase
MEIFRDENYVDFFCKHITEHCNDDTIRNILRIAIENGYNNRVNKQNLLQTDKQVASELNKLSNITYETTAANEQHYEVPTRFFLSHLGPKLKYSGCEWKENIGVSEENTFRIYQENMEMIHLEPDTNVLEIGCGWGSLSLTNAAKYPHVNFFSFSNSSTQRMYINSEIERMGIKNLTIWTQDIDDFVKNGNDIIRGKRFSRVVSIECIEHCLGYRMLFEKISTLLTDDGFCFFQIISNTVATIKQEKNSWMGRNFFTGGIVPSINLFDQFDEHLVIEKKQIVNGIHYSKTFDAWLQQMYINKPEILVIFKKEYGEQYKTMFENWRMFYLMCSESYKSVNGNNFVITYVKMKKVISA